jgi:quinol monooxygenase YgiN
LVAGREAVRFGTRLISAALIVVAAVILVTDPLNAQPAGTSWPSAGSHFQPVALYALDVVQVVAVLAACASALLAALRVRRDPGWRPALPGVAAVGLAVLMTAGMRADWPDRSVYPLLGLLAAALVWFGAVRTQPVSGRDRPAASDGVAGRAGRDLSLIHGAETGNVLGSYSAASGYPQPAGPQGAGQSRPPDGFSGPGGSRAPGSSRETRALQEPRASREPRASTGPGASREPGGFTASGGSQVAAPAEANAGSPAPKQAAGSAAPQPQKASAGPASAAARPYGRILIFTLLDDRVTEFDRLAEQAAEEVRIGEPGTLVYVIHLVPNAPLQRIFYEIYRDHAAFDRHESQPYMKRFVADRRSCVLATNVIELRLKYAKVAPLPGTPSPAAEPVPPAPVGTQQPPAPRGTQQPPAPRGTQQPPAPGGTPVPPATSRGRPASRRLEPGPAVGTLPPRGPAWTPAGRPPAGSPYGGA